MSTQYGRLCMARDRAHPITTELIIEVHAADLDAVLAHYAGMCDEAAHASSALVEIDRLRAENERLSAVADAAMEGAALMRNFLLDLRSDMREPAERQGGLHKYFYGLVCEQIAGTAIDAAIGGES